MYPDEPTKILLNYSSNENNRSIKDKYKYYGVLIVGESNLMRYLRGSVGIWK